MNILDTRDLAKRLEELQDERNTLVEAIDEAQEILDNSEEGNEEVDGTVELSDLEKDVFDAKQDLIDWDNDNKEELDDLEWIESEISEWRYGATLIDESDFVEYCQELLEDIGELPRDMPSHIVIDWEATADNLKAYYITVTYQGTYYLVRA